MKNRKQRIQKEEGKKEIQDKSTERYKEDQSFIIRCSHLDIWDEESMVRKSGFQGFYILTYMSLLIFLISNQAVQTNYQWFLRREIFDKQMRKDFLVILITWPLFYLYANITVIQWKIMTQFKIKNKFFINFIQHSTQSIPFICSSLAIFHRNWSVTHSSFVSVNLVIFFMKMHSYNQYNKNILYQNPTPNSQVLSFRNFNYFLWAPTLCYRPYYPRSNHSRRILYIIIRLGELIGLGFLFYIIFQEYLFEDINKISTYTFLTFYQKQIIPYLILTFIILLAIFESYLNIFAEVTLFGDRRFYEDFWNSTTFDEFSRKWNRPIHQFLYENIYLYLHKQQNFTKKISGLLTFVFSALLHEMIMTLIFKEIKPIIFNFMMAEFVMINTLQFMKGKILGNIIFWIGMITGTPLIATSYLKINFNFY